MVVSSQKSPSLYYSKPGSLYEFPAYVCPNIHVDKALMQEIISSIIYNENCWTFNTSYHVPTTFPGIISKQPLKNTHATFCDNEVMWINIKSYIASSFIPLFFNMKVLRVRTITSESDLTYCRRSFVRDAFLEYRPRMSRGESQIGRGSILQTIPYQCRCSSRVGASSSLQLYLSCTFNPTDSYADDNTLHTASHRRLGICKPTPSRRVR